MTPLAAGQRWVPSDGGPALAIADGYNPGLDHWVLYTMDRAPGMETPEEVCAWIARHDARLENDGAGDGNVS